MEIKLMGNEALNAFVARLPAAEVDKLMGLYVKLRAEKARVAKLAAEADDEYKVAMQAIERRLLAKADETGVTGFKVKGVATSYQSEDKKVSIADGDLFYTFVAGLGLDGLEFFEKRVSITTVEKWMKENGMVVPPGLNLFRERVMRVRKDSEK